MFTNEIFFDALQKYEDGLAASEYFCSLRINNDGKFNLVCVGRTVFEWKYENADDDAIYGPQDWQSDEMKRQSSITCVNIEHWYFGPPCW